MDADKYASCIAWVLSNFAFVMFLLATIFILLHRLIRRRLPESEIVFRWIALFGLGFTGIYAFIMHVFFPNVAGATIGWANSPFQFEVGMADLALGVLGIASFAASYQFRLAVVIVAVIMLWGDAIGHIIQMYLHDNFAVGNAGTWFWMDLAIPGILILAHRGLKPGSVIVVPR